MTKRHASTVDTHPTRYMIDTNVFVYAAKHLMGDTCDTLVRPQWSASAIALRELAPARMSVLSVTEALRTTKPKERTKMDELLSKVYAMELDAPAARLAATLMSELGSSVDVCKRCFSSKNTGPCKVYGAHCSRHQKIVDALIVATFQTSDDVDVLISEDAGVRDFVRLSLVTKPIIGILEWQNQGFPLLEHASRADSPDSSR